MGRREREHKPHQERPGALQVGPLPPNLGRVQPEPHREPVGLVVVSPSFAIWRRVVPPSCTPRSPSIRASEVLDVDALIRESATSGLRLRACSVALLVAGIACTTWPAGIGRTVADWVT